MYAIIVTGGKQYRVEQGDIVYIEKLDVEADSEVKFDLGSRYRRGGFCQGWRSCCGGRFRFCQGHQEWQGQEAEHHHLSRKEAQCSPHGPSSALHQG